MPTIPTRNQGLTPKCRKGRIDGYAPAQKRGRAGGIKPVRERKGKPAVDAHFLRKAAVPAHTGGQRLRAQVF